MVEEHEKRVGCEVGGHVGFEVGFEIGTDDGFGVGLWVGDGVGASNETNWPCHHMDPVMLRIDRTSTVSDTTLFLFITVAEAPATDDSSNPRIDRRGMGTFTWFDDFGGKSPHLELSSSMRRSWTATVASSRRSAEV